MATAHKDFLVTRFLARTGVHFARRYSIVWSRRRPSRICRCSSIQSTYRPSGFARRMSGSSHRFRNQAHSGPAIRSRSRARQAPVSRQDRRRKSQWLNSSWRGIACHPLLRGCSGTPPENPAKAIASLLETFTVPATLALATRRTTCAGRRACWRIDPYQQKVVNDVDRMPVILTMHQENDLGERPWGTPLK